MSYVGAHLGSSNEGNLLETSIDLSNLLLRLVRKGGVVLRDDNGKVEGSLEVGLVEALCGVSFWW